jgi:hypothetical protein
VVFSGYSDSSPIKPDFHDITEILLKVALNTITPPHPENVIQDITQKQIIFVFLTI